MNDHGLELGFHPALTQKVNKTDSTCFTGFNKQLTQIKLIKPKI